MHCTPPPLSLEPLPAPAHLGPPPDPQHPPPVHQEDQEEPVITLAWESCGRIVERERADYYEFVACNVVFVALALFLVVLRSKRLHALQTRHLAARIGLARSALR
jgi:hypothetical protein